MNKSQEEIVIEKLKEDGYITRNYCLRRYITRLAAIINGLNSQGWRIEGRKEEKDYKYTLLAEPGAQARMF